MIILGIDPGMSKQNPCALALIDSDSWKLIRAEMVKPRQTGDNWQDVVYQIAIDLSFIITSYRYSTQIDLIADELPHVATNIQTAIKLARIGGIVIGIAARYGIPCISVQPSEAKKALTGSGSATKGFMIAAAQEKFGVALPKDIADACGIAMAGLAKYQTK